MTRHFASATFWATLALLPDGPAFAQDDARGKPRSGEAIYKQICIACHEHGVAHAPKFGDKAAWAPLIAEGQHEVTAEAWVGVRAMPPRAGQEDLSLAEFSRAVVWMANNGGADWKEPDAALLARIGREAGKRIDQRIAELKQMKRDLAAAR